MSRAISKRSWGPSHQEMEPPFRRGPSLLWKLVGFFALALFVHTILDPRGQTRSPGAWRRWRSVGSRSCLIVALADGTDPDRLALGVDREERARHETCWGRVMARRRVKRSALRSPASAAAPTSASPLDGGWVLADPESAVMVLGPPRSGKTSAVMIPAVLGASGAVIATSTKPEVMRGDGGGALGSRPGVAV